MNWEFSPLAARQLEYIQSQYNMKLPGLGEDFLNEFALTVEQIRAFPEAWPEFTERTRSCRVRRFPYRIIYQIIGDRVLLHSIPHLHSSPESWMGD